MTIELIEHEEGYAEQQKALEDLNDFLSQRNNCNEHKQGFHLLLSNQLNTLLKQLKNFIIREVKDEFYWRKELGKST